VGPKSCQLLLEDDLEIFLKASVGLIALAWLRFTSLPGAITEKFGWKHI